MSAQDHIHTDEIRTLFSRAMSDMYRTEVPQYGTLVELVSDVNNDVLARDPETKAALERKGELSRLDVERHGAIRLGTSEELFNIRRLFAVMGMYAVGYYDLSVAGVPVHSTCFRPIDDAALARNPFRIFTSLLRLELIEDEPLRAEAAGILAKRKIFTPRAMELIAAFEANGGLAKDEADEFVREALETFRWHSEATVSAKTYQKLHDSHRLIADVVSFKGPHINHLTPRTLDIDAVQEGMPRRGITPKAVVEGPSPRKCPILLRQTSFKALEEQVVFEGVAGNHTARFGEIEQRGVAVTPKGRALYDRLLAAVRDDVQVDAKGDNVGSYESRLAAAFTGFPDDWDAIRAEGLAFFHYSVSDAGREAAARGPVTGSVGELIEKGYLSFDPITYEDFLPVSAAGIFQSNLGTDEQKNYAEKANRNAFEASLGASVRDEMELYAQAERASLEAAMATLGSGKAVA